MARRTGPWVNATLIVAALTVLGWGLAAGGPAGSGSGSAAAAGTAPPRSDAPTVPITRQTIPATSPATRVTVPPPSTTTHPPAPSTTPAPAPTTVRPPISRPVRRHVVRPPVYVPTTTTVPPPTTTTTILAIGGHLPPPPSTVPFTTKGTSAHVSPVFAALSGAGFFVALVIMTTRFLITSPRRHKQRA